MWDEYISIPPIKHYFEMYAKADFEDDETRRLIFEYFIDKIYVFDEILHDGSNSCFSYHRVGNDQNASDHDQEHGNVLDRAYFLFHEYPSAEHGEHGIYGKDGVG